ncbi:MAG TPA: hypothetical protein P5274_01225 [Candidatus Paceibacterota bacterium]|nr:hypothetical protein [Candidatus Paceibacterota bacterium]
MANLLTIEAKKKNIHDRQLRQLVVVLGLLVSLFLVALIFNLALWLNFNIQKRPLSLKSSLADSSVVMAEESLARDKITQLAKWWTKSNWSVAIAKIEEVRPATIKIYQIAGVFTEKGQTLTMMLNGQTTSRQDLVKFTDDLRQDDFFSAVDLPIESLLIGNNGQFSINLSLRNHD